MNIYKSLSAATIVLLTAGACSAEPKSDNAASSANTGTLTVEVSNIRNTKGRVMIALYDKQSAFATANEAKAFAALSMRVTGKKAGVSFERLPSGNYAALLFHDENGNGNFDMKGGEPLEGYGVSGAMHALDEPGFDKASAKVGQGKQTLMVKMHYYK